MATNWYPGPVIGFDPDRARFFVVDDRGRLWERRWDARLDWEWIAHPAPPGTFVRRLGPVLGPDPNQAKFFVAGTDGGLSEHYLDTASNLWRWTYHGRPPNDVEVNTFPDTAVGFDPGRAKLLVLASIGDRAQARLFERAVRPTLDGWVWFEHGAPPGSDSLTPPDGVIGYAPDQAKFLVIEGHETGAGRLLEHHLDPAVGRWEWFDHGTPASDTKVTAVGAVIGYDPSLSFFVAGGDGHLWQYYVDRVSGSWTWLDHGTPATVFDDGNGFHPVPGVRGFGPLIGFDPNLARFFVASTDGHLWERYLNAARDGWLWADHGTPLEGSALTVGPVIGFDPNRARFFVGGADGHLWERSWDVDGWHWVDHGVPPPPGA